MLAAATMLRHRLLPAFLAHAEWHSSANVNVEKRSCLSLRTKLQHIKHQGANHVASMCCEGRRLTHQAPCLKDPPTPVQMGS